ncbi:phage tail tape measure protein [Sodalis glossinidius]|uniref:phage tail tape measure protein n=1 Tax=Sodalis glossinidius TaxID=63612 RepID=UPI00030BD908|nr:phage tail tape measure protein [Sodalis glossinidius]
MNDTSGRWNPYRQLYGHVYTVKTGTVAELIAFGAAFNDPHLTIAGYETTIQTALVEGGALRIQRDVTTYKKNSYGVADNSYLDKEYAARAATTANAIQLFKNQMYAASVSMGEIFLPTINRTIKRFMPFIEKFREWAKTHKEVIKSVAKMGLYLLGTATAVGVVTRAFRIFNSVMKMSTLGKLITLMVIGGGLIVDNWDTIGPIVKSVWHNIDGVIQAIGGWETVLAGILVFVTTKWAVDMVKSIRNVTREMKTLAKNSPSGIKGVLGKAGLIEGISLGVEPLVDKGLNAGGNEWFQNLRTARDWGEFGRSLMAIVTWLKMTRVTGNLRKPPKMP